MIVIIIIIVNFVMLFSFMCLAFLDCLFVFNIQVLSSSSVCNVQDYEDVVSDDVANHHLLNARPY